MAFVAYFGTDGAVDQHRRALWSRMAYASRYGHQQIDVLGARTLEEVDEFNDALHELIKKENESGGSRLDRLATGG